LHVDTHEEIPVPKKLLIAAAVAVAGMLALTPLAFANDYDRDRGGNETTSFSVEDDSAQRNQVNLCSSDQDVDVLPSTVVGALLPSVSQEQNGNCVNIADGASAEPTAPPTTTTTTTTPPPNGQDPPADRVVFEEGGEVWFEWDSEIPAGAETGDVIFEITRACPFGYALEGIFVFPRTTRII
jgi:hypothetical protein